MDRNRLVVGFRITLGGSLSARRAWIEIAQDRRVSGRPLVALRKESVDRNLNHQSYKSLLICRSPQGERG